MTSAGTKDRNFQRVITDLRVVGVTLIFRYENFWLFVVILLLPPLPSFLNGPEITKVPINLVTDMDG